jgi:putative transcriptional regulator
VYTDRQLNKVGNEEMLVHKISEYRRKAGMTQQQLADKLGWTLRKLTSYERNERIPPLPEALEIAQALGTTVDKIWKLEKEGN